MANQRFLSAHLDFFGFSASIACALHCAAIPFILAMSSISSLGFLDHPLLEGGILLLGAIIAFLSLLPAYYKKHKQLRPILLILSGFIIIISAKFFEQALHEGVLSVAGACLVATAHYTNWKLSKKSTTKS